MKRTMIFLAAMTALVAGADTFVTENDEYEHTAETNLYRMVVNHTWVGKKRGHAYAIEFIAFTNMGYRFTTVAAEGQPVADEDEELAGRPRTQTVSTMVQRLIDQGEEPIAAVNGCFFNDYTYFCPYGATICDSRFKNGGMMDINTQRYLVETWDHKLFHGKLIKGNSMGSAAAIPSETGDLWVMDEDDVYKRVRNVMCSYFEFNPYQTVKEGEVGDELEEGVTETETDGVVTKTDHDAHARTLAGYTKDRSKFIFFVSDQSGSSLKGGGTAGRFWERDAAKILVDMGYWEIGHFDGGGSSTLWFNEKTGGVAGEHIVNAANYGATSERPVASAMVILAPKEPQPTVVAQIPLVYLGYMTTSYGEYYDLDEPFEGALLKEKDSYTGKCDSLHLIKPVTVDHEIFAAGYDNLEIKSSRTSPYSAPITFTNGGRLNIGAQTNITRKVEETNLGNTITYTTNLVHSTVLLKHLVIVNGDNDGTAPVHVESNSVCKVGSGFCGDIETAQISGFRLVEGITNDIRIVCNEVDRENDDPMELYFGYVDFTTKGSEETSLDRLKNPWNDPTIWAAGSNGKLRWAIAKVRVGETLYETFDEALAAAENGDVIEVFRPCTYKSAETFNLVEGVTNLTITCSEADPTACPIECASGSKITLGNGARIVFSNVCFRTEGRSLVEFATSKNGRAAFAGKIGLGELTLNGEWNHFELAGAIELVDDGLTVVCNDLYSSPLERDVGDQFGLWSGEASEVGEAAKILLDGDDELCGGVDDNSNLVWAVKSVSPSEAAVGVVYDDNPAVTNYFKSINKVAPYLTNDATVVIYADIPAERMNRKIAIAAKIRIASAGESVRHRLTPASSARFSVGASGELTLENVVFADYTGEALFEVAGGDLYLESGAELTNLVGNVNYGPLQLKTGTLTMTNGARIVNCQATVSKSGWGGGIYQAGGTLRLYGGEIRGCYAYKYGGGVYSSIGDLELKGPIVIDGNACGINKTFQTNDIHITIGSVAKPVKIVGGMTGAKVGLKFATNYKSFGIGNASGYYFAEIDSSLSEEEVAALPDAFANQFDPATLYAAVDYSTDPKRLVWKSTVREDGQCDEGDAVLGFEYGDGATNYYASLAMAFDHITNDCTIALKRDLTFNEIIYVGYDVVLTGGHTITRGGDKENAIIVDGGSLTLENVTLNGGKAGGVLLAAGQLTKDGTTSGKGKITLGAGSVIAGISGGEGRVSSGVFINGNSELVMKPGAVVRDCVNTYVNEGQLAGFGAGIYVNGGTARFEGGLVTGCRAFRAAGVFIGQYGTAYVGGDFTVTNNTDLSGANLENLVIEDHSKLYMASPLTGRIGVTDGVQCDTNLVGYIENYSAWNATVASNSAACFYHDSNGARGLVETDSTVRNTTAAVLPPTTMAVTADEGLTRIVWGVASEDPEPTPDPPTPDPEYVDPKPIAFKSITWDRDADEWHLVLTDVVQYCVYRLYATNDLAGGFVIDGIDPVRIDTNKTTTVEYEYIVEGEGKQRFWRATAERGVKPTE